MLSQHPDLHPSKRNLLTYEELQFFSNDQIYFNGINWCVKAKQKLRLPFKDKLFFLLNQSAFLFPQKKSSKCVRSPKQRKTYQLYNIKLINYFFGTVIADVVFSFTCLFS